MVRKIKDKKTKKKQDKDMKEKIGLFHMIPDECLSCSEPFDKTNKEQVTTWNVVVREEEKVVRLYCPECWSKATQVVQEFEQKIREREGLE
jgi:Zn finger protein HypA/HybF involved in hydrogenase expression